MVDKDHEWIVRYQAGELSFEEKVAFELRLSQEPELAEMLRVHEGVNLALEESYQSSVAGEIRGMLMGVPAPEVPVREMSGFRLQPWMWGVVASVVLLLGVGLWYGLRPPLHERLFAEHFEPYKTGGPQRSPNMSSNDSLFVEGWQKYESRSYQEAIHVFEKIPAEYSNHSRVQFYLGISQLALNNWKAAETIFLKIVEKQEEPYVMQAQWYLGLTYLGQGEVERAGKIMRENGNDDGSAYQEKAKEILKLLTRK